MLTEHHIPNRQSGTFYQLYLATAVYQWSILQQHSEHFVERDILPVNVGACLSLEDELAQEHERIGYRLEGEEYFIVKPALSPLQTLV